MKIPNGEKNSSLDADYKCSANVSTIADKLYEIINHSYVLSGNCLSIKINDRNFSLRELWWECQNKLKQLQKGKEKTDFLAVSILEDTFRKALPLLLVSVEDIANGDYSQPSMVNDLKKIFEHNEYTNLWNKKAAEYKRVIESLGFTLEFTDYEDLTAIMEPLLNALTFYEGGDYYETKPSIKQVRKGNYADTQPKIMTTICKFSSAKEYVDALEMCTEEAIISFGAVEETEGQRIDVFTQYLSDGKRFDERTANGLRNEKITLEEYKNKVCKHTRVVYLGVKNGGNIWLIHMPYRQENYSYYEDSSARFYYGKRAGYAPYEVFFKDNKAMPDGTTYLATRRNGYRLNEIMDDFQKIWFPVFIEETRGIFFKAARRDSFTAEEIYLPEEVVARASGAQYEIIPTFAAPSAIKTYCYNIPSPNEVFADEPLMTELIEYFHISVEDIKDAPLIRNNIYRKEELEEYLLNNIRKAYIKTLSKKIGCLLDGKWTLRGEIVYYLTSHKWQVVELAQTGAFRDFTEITIDKEAERDKEGNIVTKKSWSYSGCKEVPVISATSSTDGREFKLTTLLETFYNFTIWVGSETTNEKPPVLLKINPRTIKEFSTLLPEAICSNPIIQYAEHLQYFENKYQNALPGTIIDKYPRKGSPVPGNIHFPKFAEIYICMKKTEYKKWNKRDNT